MRVIVVGAGAVGGFVGARLALAGHRVTLVGRPRLVEAVRAQGLRLIEPRQGHLLLEGVHAVSSVAEASAFAPFDVALLTVRTYDVPAAVRQMRESDLGHPLVVCLQNGVGSEELASQTFGAEWVIGASLTHPVAVPEPGVVRLAKERGGVALAPVGPGVDVGPLTAALEEAGLDVRLYRDYRAVKWSKMPLNIMGNAVPAILDLPPDEVYAHDGLLRLELATVREQGAVMRALGVRVVDLPGYSIRPLMWALCRLPVLLVAPLLRRKVAGGRKGRMPSLQRGLAQGRTVSEVSDLNGAIVRYGERAGVPTPANRVVTETLEAIYAGERDWDEWRHQPERLVEAWIRAQREPCEG